MTKNTPHGPPKVVTKMPPTCPQNGHQNAPNVSQKWSPKCPSTCPKNDHQNAPKVVPNPCDIKVNKRTVSSYPKHD